MIKRNFLVILIFGVASFIISLFASVLFFGSQNSQKVKTVIIPKEVLRYPALQSLRANIEGTILKISADSLIVKNGEKELLIKFEMNGFTSFRDSVTNEPVQISELKIGQRISGGITIAISTEYIVGMNNKQVGDIIAHSFLVFR